MNEESHERIYQLCKKRNFSLTILNDHYSFFNRHYSTMVHLYIDTECLAGKDYEKISYIPLKYKKIGTEKDHISNRKNSVHIANTEGDFYRKYKQQYEYININLLVVRIPHIKFLDKNIAFRVIKEMEIKKKHKVFIVQYIGYPEKDIELIKKGSCSWGCCNIGNITCFNIIETIYDKNKLKYTHFVKEEGVDDDEFLASTRLCSE